MVENIRANSSPQCQDAKFNGHLRSHKIGTNHVFIFMFFLVDGKIRIRIKKSGSGQIIWIRILGAQKHTGPSDPEYYQHRQTIGNIIQIHMHILLPKFAVVISFINLRHCFW